MEFGRPFPANDGKHKLAVWVFDPARGPVLVRFGAVGYEDFTTTGDWSRRASYLRRSAGIRNGRGNLTSGDPLSPSFWARRVLWLSGEPMVYVGPR